MKSKKEEKIDNKKLVDINKEGKIETTITSLNNMKENIKNVLESNKESVENTYKILDKELDKLNDKDELYKFCITVKEDCEKALENENLTKEERSEILDREMKIIEILSEREKNIQDANIEIAKMEMEKDSENKKFLWAVLGVATTVALGAIGAKFGGNYLKNK